jgi:phosphoserine phosphatase
MATQEKRRAINGLTRKLAPLTDQKETLDDEANRLAENRNKLNEEVRNLCAEIQELRSERDQTNEKVKELKLLRNTFTVRISEKIQEMKKLSEERRDFSKETPSASHKALEEEVETIDWKIQTSSLTLQEEKDLVGKVKVLETRLSAHRRLEKLNRKIDALHSEVRNLKVERERCHEALTAHSQKSQEIHAKMLARIGVSRKTKMEADDAHRRFLETREKAKPVREEIAVISSKIRELENEVREENEKERKQSESLLRQTLESRAMEKLKRGEKLSWEEFQLIAEKGLASKD